jgi:Rps23 Pro-64 3,4-dihydroxylase Tpa1-like proline 4-hydroxylase
MSKAEVGFSFEQVVSNTALLKLAEGKILTALDVNENDLSLIWKLAENYRKQGRLGEAAELYRQLEVSNFNTGLAKDLRAILEGGLDDFAGRSSCYPVPFKLEEDFLSEGELSRLLDHIDNNAWGSRKRSTINAAEYDPEKRQSYDLGLPEWLKEKFFEYIGENWHGLSKALKIKPQEYSKVHLYLRAYKNGHFFGIHTDRSSNVSRLLSMAYFFYFEPKSFDGGDLLVFDTNLSESSKREFSHNFTRIKAQQNTLAIFPSASFHSVTKVESLIEGPSHCRYAVNAHVWEENSVD